MFVDGRQYSMFADKHGTLKTDCNACAANFDAILNKLRTGRQFLVVLADGRSSSFPIKGAAKALPKTDCITGFAS
jgi:hypothetical protein